MSVVVRSNPIRLCGGGEECIRLMHFSHEHEKQAIRDCISRYAMPDTFSGILNWLVYRVTNAFNSLFGSSEWQIAQNVIQLSAIRLAHQKGFFSNSPREIQNKIQDMVAKNTLNQADSILEFCLSMQEIRATTGSVVEAAGIMTSLLDLNYYLDNDLRLGVERIRAGSTT